MTVNIWMSYMWTAVEEANMEAMLAVIWTLIMQFTYPIFRPYFQYYLSSVHNCEDRFHIRFFNHSSHTWFSYIYSHWSQNLSTERMGRGNVGSNHQRRTPTCLRILACEQTFIISAAGRAFFCPQERFGTSRKMFVGGLALIPRADPS